MSLTLAQLRAIMPHLSEPKAIEYLAPMNEAMGKHGITTPAREAAFLAQIAHESGELRYWAELGDGKAYEGRKSLGNLHPGDGPLYKGRGPIQLTGRANYVAAGAALGLDLVEHPEMVAEVPLVGLSVAAWFWSVRGLSRLADARNMREITVRINGGLNGLTQRMDYYDVAYKVLKVEAHPGQGEKNV